MMSVETVTAPTIPTIDRETDREIDADGDHDRFAHYVRKDKILTSAVDGAAVVALCGKKWVPNRDPQRYPVCPTCKEIYLRMKGGGGDDGDS